MSGFRVQREIEKKLEPAGEDKYSREDVIRAWDRIVASPHGIVEFEALQEELGRDVVDGLVRNNVVTLHAAVPGWEVLDGYGKPDKALISAGGPMYLRAVKKGLERIRREIEFDARRAAQMAMEREDRAGLEEQRAALPQRRRDSDIAGRRLRSRWMDAIGWSGFGQGPRAWPTRARCWG